MWSCLVIGLADLAPVLTSSFSLKQDCPMAGHEALSENTPRFLIDETARFF